MVLIRYDILYDIIKVGHFDTFVGNYASYVKGILCLKACYNKWLLGNFYSIAILYSISFIFSIVKTFPKNQELVNLRFPTDGFDY